MGGPPLISEGHKGRDCGLQRNKALSLQIGPKTATSSLLWLSRVLTSPADFGLLSPHRGVSQVLQTSLFLCMYMALILFLRGTLKLHQILV